MIFDFWKKKPKKKTIQKSKTLPPTPRPKPEPYIPPPRPKETVSPKPRSDIPRMQKKEPKLEHHDAKKEFLKIFKQLTYRHHPWEVWKDFVVMFACALSNPVDKTHYDDREALYMRTIKKYNKQEQALFPELTAETVMALEENPEQDFLGGIFMELDLGNNAKAQIFTPYNVCDMMARMVIGNDIVSHIEEHGYFTINDPCCGAGATLIAGVHEAKRQRETIGLL